MIQQVRRTESKDNESLRLSTLSPNSDIIIGDSGGATTPLPFFFSEEERENAVGRTFSNSSDKSNTKTPYGLPTSSSGGGFGGHSSGSSGGGGGGSSDRLFHPYQAAPDNAHSIFVNRGSSNNPSNNIGVSSSSSSKRGQKQRWAQSGGSHGHNQSMNNPPAHGGHGHGHPHGARSDSSQRGARLPPTPVYSDHRDTSYGRPPQPQDRRDGPPADYFPPPYGMHHPPPSMAHGHPPHNDRVRNLRGRAPPHHAPMPLQVPPMNSHHILTSPMGMHPSKGAGPGMWGGMHHHHPSQHHHHHHHHSQLHHLPAPLELNPSKRKCVPLKPPIPSKFQGYVFLVVDRHGYAGKSFMLCVLVPVLTIDLRVYEKRTAHNCAHISPRPSLFPVSHCVLTLSISIWFAIPSSLLQGHGQDEDSTSSGIHVSRELPRSHVSEAIGEPPGGDAVLCHVRTGLSVFNREQE